MYHAIVQHHGRDPYATDGFPTLAELDADLMVNRKTGLDEEDIIVQVHMDGTITVGTVNDTFEADWEASALDDQPTIEPVSNPWRVPFLTEQRNA